MKSKLCSLWTDAWHKSIVGIFLSIVVGHVSGHGTPSECVAVKISGSLYHHDTDGLYFLDSNSCNSRRQWIHESGKRYLYYILDGYDGWMIGPLSCRWGDFVISIKSNEEDPFNIPSMWKEFEDEWSLWRNNTHLRVQCVDDSIYETRIVDCQMQPCADGATCVISNGAASKCLCQRGFYGRFCETAIDTNHCNSSPCLNGATCTDLINDFQCKCMSEFSGRQCDILIKGDFNYNEVDCDAKPCQEHCPNKPVLSCFSTRDILVLAGVCATAIIITLILILLARCLYLKQHNLTAMEQCSTSEESIGWKDVSYKRLESLDSVLTMDRIGI